MQEFLSPNTELTKTLSVSFNDSSTVIVSSTPDFSVTNVKVLVLYRTESSSEVTDTDSFHKHVLWTAVDTRNFQLDLATRAQLVYIPLLQMSSSENSSSTELYRAMQRWIDSRADDSSVQLMIVRNITDEAEIYREVDEDLADIVEAFLVKEHEFDDVVDAIAGPWIDALDQLWQHPKKFDPSRILATIAALDQLVVNAVVLKVNQTLASTNASSLHSVWSESSLKVMAALEQCITAMKDWRNSVKNITINLWSHPTPPNKRILKTTITHPVLHLYVDRLQQIILLRSLQHQLGSVLQCDDDSQDFAVFKNLNPLAIHIGYSDKAWTVGFSTQFNA